MSLMHATDRLNAALAGRYRIERELGLGGMATVYLAHDVRHDRRVEVDFGPGVVTYFPALALTSANQFCTRMSGEGVACSLPTVRTMTKRWSSRLML